jgi:PAS domain S-box-containing protein
VSESADDRRWPIGIAEESGELHRLLVEGVQDYAIFALDPSGHILSWNAGAQRIKGYSADEAIGRHFSIFYPRGLVAQGFPDFELATAANTGRFEDEGWRVRKDGSQFWANVVITALRDRDGKLIGFAKVTRDLTERRGAEERALDAARREAAQDAARLEAEAREGDLRELTGQLQRQAIELAARTAEAEEARQRADEARHRADDANLAKGQFLTAMSHELRTPLNAIGGYTDLITMGLSGPVTDQQLEQLRRVKRSQEHLLGIINDILNFSRVEAGQLTYDLGNVVIRDVVDSVAQMIMLPASNKQLRITDADCPPGVSAWADRAKVEQIVLNLLSNAVKFTAAKGEIGLSCERLDDGRVAIAVRDTGCGIPREYLGAIFEPFMQIGRSLTATREGTGLGLAISRDLARAMHGDITVDSTIDGGSVFTLTLPASQ